MEGKDGDKVVVQTWLWIVCCELLVSVAILARVCFCKQIVPFQVNEITEPLVTHMEHRQGQQGSLHMSLGSLALSPGV